MLTLAEKDILSTTDLCSEIRKRLSFRLIRLRNKNEEDSEVKDENEVDRCDVINRKKINRNT